MSLILTRNQITHESHIKLPSKWLPAINELLKLNAAQVLGRVSANTFLMPQGHGFYTPDATSALTHCSGNLPDRHKVL